MVGILEHLKTGLEIKVKTRANETKLVQEADNFTMYVKSPPVDNKANNELIKFFKKKYGVRVSIVRGKTSRRKLLKHR
jgi:uncharacterized protein (TIGR00251 family)